ncbi:MAG TPA: hypothetical protein PLE19_14020 [Planctomycetota bacterium]|nr:hypothetical protein [Planctomycetota bacterium]HRR79565.1 hypothetical protein [Planctomycetota bacterium]HRT94408.1 hypothetical protein [Planctomycetota bacterium]
MASVTLELSDAQVLDLVRRLPATTRAAVIRELIPDLDALDGLVEYGSARIRELCAERGVDWDHLTEEERQRLIDDLLHEE